MTDPHVKYKRWCLEHPDVLRECEGIATDPDGLGWTPEQFREHLKRLYCWLQTDKGKGRAKKYGGGRYGWKPFIVRNMTKGNKYGERTVPDRAQRETGVYRME